MDAWYYTNCKGAVAFSVDEGETVCLPTGRRIPWSDAWEETMDDLETSLTETQQAVLKAHRDRPPLSEMEGVYAAHGKRERQAEKGHYRPPPPPPVLPESAMVVTSDLKD